MDSSTTFVIMKGYNVNTVLDNSLDIEQKCAYLFINVVSSIDVNVMFY